MASSALGVILAVLASLIMTSNALVAVALLCLIRKSGSKGLWFIFNLAIADGMVGFTVVGLVSDEFSQPFQPRQVFCVLRMAFVTSSSAASIISLILVAGDRHLAIRKPFHYFQLVTGWWVGVRLVGVWLVAAIIGFFPLLTPGFQNLSVHHKKCSFFEIFHPAYMLTVFCFGFFPALFLFIYLYCDMLKIASAHVQQIREVEQAGLAGGCPPSRPTSDMKAMRTVAVLIGCFTVSWLPFFIASIAQTVCPGCFHYGVIENYLWLLGLCNSLLNPLLYSCWQKDVRLQLSQLAAAVKRRILLHLGSGRRLLGRGTKSLPTVSCPRLQD